MWRGYWLRHYFFTMGIAEVLRIFSAIADGFEDACAQCLEDNSGVVLDMIHEQLYSGLDAGGNHLSPTYDDDPYFEEKGPWYHCAEEYKKWKGVKTPPDSGRLLGLPPRPEAVPNLYIDGTFYSEITAKRSGNMLVISPGSGNGPSIVSKYGDEILGMGLTAICYFNETYMRPAISEYFKKCGYK